MRNDYELGNFAEAIQQRTDETKSRRGTMMSWIAFVAIQRRKDDTNNRRGTIMSWATLPRRSSIKKKKQKIDDDELG
jgi:hypothetical protein